MKTDVNSNQCHLRFRRIYQSELRLLFTRAWLVGELASSTELRSLSESSSSLCTATITAAAAAMAATAAPINMTFLCISTSLRISSCFRLDDDDANAEVPTSMMDVAGVEGSMPNEEKDFKSAVKST
jgi:hypothetical protein